jgi:hypothetical protein
MSAERFVAKCFHCGTGYTVRSWYWLESLGVERYGEGGFAAVELRQCAVPGCCQTLSRRSELAAAVACVRGEAANDVR